MSSSADPHWTQIFSALLTPTVAILGLYIAYCQYRAAQNKLKMDLFDKRFAVYDASRNLIKSIISSGKAQDDQMHLFLAGTREAKWLFKEEIDYYLNNQLWGKVVDLQTLEAELQSMPVGEDRIKKVHEQSEIKKWMIKQLHELDVKFASYLKLSHKGFTY